MNAAVGPSFLIGRELGHYRIVEKIGEGGMGEVFLAHDEHLGHGVALKVLPSNTDEHTRHLFRKEAHALSKLNHPNIVTVLDFDTQETVDFLVMEYVPGQALDEKVREGAIPEREVIDIGVQLAEGLAAAHAQGVVHRDLKPGNLRLTNDNRLKILDFGLARSTLNFSPVATTLSVDGPPDCSGTLPYMAPEQLLGQAADARTDIYSAGAVLYELCTGRPPFEQKLFTGMVDEILHSPPSPPSRCQRGISREFESIVVKCLQKNPEQRYPTARQLAYALHQLRETESKNSNSRHGRTARSAWIALQVLALMLLCVLGWGVYRHRLLPIQSVPRIQSMAVLPFDNLSGDPQQEYLADGITDLLITDLGQMHVLDRIISRTSVVRYKTEKRPLREVAGQLNVDAVIEGSVVRSAKTVRVTVRLFSGSEDRELWSHSYESEFRDLLALQHEISLAIVHEIKSNFNAENRQQLPATRSVEPEVQEAYLRGRYLQSGTAEQRLKAREYFEQAVRLDPQHAPSYAGLADSYWSDIHLPARQAMPKARDYALKAISLDETLAQAHTALASVQFYGDWDWTSADREYRRALELNPNDAEAHRMYSVFLAALGSTEDALAQLRFAQELDPLYTGNTTAGWELYCARRYDEALQQCQKGLELHPNDESAHGCASYSYLGKEMYAQALEEGRKAWTLSGQEPVWRVLIGRANAGGGNKPEALKIVNELLAQSRKTYVPPTFLAILYTALGKNDMAFRWLDRAYAERDLYLAWIKVDPAFDPLRSDRRFQSLLRRLGFSP